MFFFRTDFTIITLTVFIMEMPSFITNSEFDVCLKSLYNVGFIYTTGVLNYKYKLIGMKEEDVIRVYLPGQLESLIPSKDKYYSFNQYNGRSEDKIQDLQLKKANLKDEHQKKYFEELELTTLNAPRLVRNAKTWCAMKICQGEYKVEKSKNESDNIKDYKKFFIAAKLTLQEEKEALCLLNVCYDELIDLGFTYENYDGNYETLIGSKSINSVTIKSFTEFQQEYINRFYYGWPYISPATFCLIQACWDELEKYGVKYVSKVVQSTYGLEVIYTAILENSQTSSTIDGKYMTRYYDHMTTDEGTTVPEVWCGIQVCVDQLYSVGLNGDTGIENESAMSKIENTDHFPEFALLYQQYLLYSEEAIKSGSTIWCENYMKTTRYNYYDNTIDISNDDTTTPDS